MLLKMGPEQIMAHWERIKDCVAASLPPIAQYTDATFVHIQEELLIGAMEAWIITDSSRAIYGLMTTKISLDDVTLTRNLVIFTLTLTERHPNTLWREHYDVLRKYAQDKKCSKIIAYTNSKHLLQVATQLGADTSWSLVYFSVQT